MYKSYNSPCMETYHEWDFVSIGLAFACNQEQICR